MLAIHPCQRHNLQGMSFESPSYNFNRDPLSEQTRAYCSHINAAVEMARDLRQSPDDYELKNRLENLVTAIHHEGAAGIYRFKVLIPYGASAHESKNYKDIINSAPEVFEAEKVNRIDIEQADFFSEKNSDIHLTSFDLKVTVVPDLPE